MHFHYIWINDLKGEKYVRLVRGELSSEHDLTGTFFDTVVSEDSTSLYELQARSRG